MWGMKYADDAVVVCMLPEGLKGMMMVTDNIEAAGQTEEYTVLQIDPSIYVYGQRCPRNRQQQPREKTTDFIHLNMPKTIWPAALNASDRHA